LSRRRLNALSFHPYNMVETCIDYNKNQSKKIRNICSDGTGKINTRGVYPDSTDYNKN